MVHIRDTLSMSSIHISESLVGEARGLPGIAVDDRPQELSFDGEGNLQPIDAEWTNQGH